MPQLDDHIAPTKKQNSDLSSDLADFVNVNESLESEEAEDINVIEFTSDSEKESVENRNSDSESETGDALFNPSLSNQRHQKVLDILREENCKSILDLGCNNLKFLSLVKNIQGISYMAGVDIDREILMERPYIVSAPVCRWLEERPDDFLSELWHGDVTDSDSASILQGVEVVTAIELIEHLDLCVLDKFSDTVLGVIKPKLWIVTTPNRDYNELFPDWPGPEARRHWDHKFEWSRNEFKNWIEEVVVKYPDYYVQMEGVGYHQQEEYHESHGPASQIVIFRSTVERSYQIERCNSEVEDDISSNISWERVSQFFMPKKIDPRDNHQKILDEVDFHATCLARDQMMKMMTEEPYERPESVSVPLDIIMSFDSVKRLSTDILEIKDVLLNAGLKCTSDGLVIKFSGDTESECYDDDCYLD